MNQPNISSNREKQHSNAQISNPELSHFNNKENNKQENSNERRVIRQFIEALLFEKIIPYDYEHGVFYFSLATIDFQAKGYIGGFDRIRLTNNSIQLIHDKQCSAVGINTLVDALSAHLSTPVKIKQQLLTELHQTIYLCDWNDKQRSNRTSRRHLNYIELESNIDEGHPYHPCYKARTGFSLNDHALYGPEQGNHFQLHWLAVRRCYLKQSLNNQGDSFFWQTELTTDAWVTLQRRMQELDSSWLEYGLLPVHPWQWANLQAQIQPVLNAKHLIYLGAAGDDYQASISVRTLINVTRPHKANIKLPMNMVNSSSLRTLEPHSVCTAPLISRWLSDVIDNDEFFQHTQALGLLTEYAGILLADPDVDSSLSKPSHHWTTDLAGQLAVIFRESIHAHSSAQEPFAPQKKQRVNNINVINDQLNNTVPFVALTQVEADKSSFIHPWIEHYGCKNWLSQLIDVAIIPVWHLLVHHGIALEAHAQNMILQHKDGWPEKIILRDFHESLEYVEDYLADASKVPDFQRLYPCYRESKDNQYFWMKDVEALRELVIDTLFVFNLSELAVLLESHHQFTEQQFWQLVDERLQYYQEQAHTSAERIEAIHLYQKNIQTESLLKKKLSGDSSLEFHHQIRNPLGLTENNANNNTS